MRKQLTVLLAVAVAACSPPDREAEVREFLADAVAAAEARDTGFFRAHIAESYADGRGRRRDDVINFVRGMFLTNPSIEVVSRIESIELDGDDFAVAVLQAGVVGSRGGLDIDASLQRVELELVRAGRSWEVIAASWDGP